MNKLKYITIGFILGAILTAPIVYAATFKLILINSSGAPIGTDSNPLYITSD